MADRNPPPIPLLDSQQEKAAPSPPLPSHNADVLDPWFPRPLVSSRCPIGEEGTFITMCPHFMHASCKERYASQLKTQAEQMARQ